MLRSNPVFSKLSSHDAPAANGTGWPQYSVDWVRPVSPVEPEDHTVTAASEDCPMGFGVTAAPPPLVPVTLFSEKNTLPLLGGAGEDTASMEHRMRHTFASAVDG